MGIQQGKKRRLRSTVVSGSLAILVGFGVGLSIGLSLRTMDPAVTALEGGPLAARFLGLRDTVQWVLDEGRDDGNSMPGTLSPSGIKAYNKAARSFNAAFGKSARLEVFREDTTPNLVTHPRAIEIMGEIDFALRMLSNATDVKNVDEVRSPQDAD
ncbi:MAG: hypothetical protein OXQ90_19260 [Gammaproteobacteria bacterium]|nr:hypothetical protein [Gammaproteobacteria bacterium]